MKKDNLMKGLFVVSLLLSLSLVSCQEQSNEGEVTLVLRVLGNNETSQFAFKDATLLDILKNKYEVKLKKIFYTEYVECINEVCANDEYSWLYYVNDKPMNLGVDVYKVKDRDVVLFAYRKV